MALDWENEQFRKLLHEAVDYIADFYAGLPGKKVFHGKTPPEVRASFAHPMPELGTGAGELLKTAIPRVFESSTLNVSPRFFGYVMSGGSQMGIIAEMLSAALNQNHTKWHLSAAAAEIERAVIGWISEFIGYREEAGGILVSGGSAANLSCLAVARKKMCGWDAASDGFFDHPPITLYASAETHSCIDKAADLLGIGKKHLRKIDTLEDMTIRVDHLEKRIQEDLSGGLHPFCVVGNAGTVNSGAVDPLETLADICDKRKLWFHVDGAYGAPAAQTAAAGHLFRGLARADSIAVDPHKWLQVPFEAGCALVRDWEDLSDTFSLLPDYLKSDLDTSERFDFLEHGFELSRNFKALKVWLQFLTYGANRLRSVVEENILLMRHFGKLVEADPEFELLAPVPLSVVCFRYSPDRFRSDEKELERFNQAILAESEKDGRFFITSTRVSGKFALRACCINHRADKPVVEELFEYLRELGKKLSGRNTRGATKKFS